MPLPDLDQDFAPIPRSREENQERAFISASRRKDRSLDSRLKSANRASMLHEKRTGNAFRITKEIVKKEAMYEEVDERYQEKRIRMLQAQNLQVKEQFYHHSQRNLAAYANSQSNGSSFVSLRASNMTPRALIDGGSCAMGSELSYIRSSFSQGPGALASPMATADDYVLSPTTSFEPSAQSYMACMSGSETPSTNIITSLPKVVALSAETKSTPDFWPNPNTPLSLTTASAAQATMAPTIEVENDGIMVFHEGLAPEINEFGEFSLGNSSHPLPDWEQPFGFDDYSTLDDFATVSSLALFASYTH